MSTIVQINKFDGGIAEDIRTFASDENEKSLNFDILTNPHKLTPYGDSIAETITTSGVMADLQISDVDVSLIGSSYLLTGSGYESSGSSKPTFYTKPDIVSGFQQQAVAAANTYQKNSLVVYKDKAYALAFNVGAGQYTLYRFNSAGSVTSIGTINSASIFYAKPFVHPEDNVLYICIGTTITSWDGTTLTTTTTILPEGFEADSLTDYGTYLAITMRPLRGAGSSVTYLWGRDASINTLQGQINWGEGTTIIVENLYNVLVAIVQPHSTFSTAFTNKIIVRGWSGGAVQELKSIVVGSSDYINPIKVKNSDKLYFGSQNADDCVYLVTKNKSGRWIISKDRYLFNGVTTTAGIRGLTMIGDTMWRGVNSTYTLMRSKIRDGGGETVTYSASSIYRTTINAGMKAEDRYKDKTLEAVQVSYTGKTNGTIKLKYSVDGSTFVDIVSETTTATESIWDSSSEVDADALLSGKEFQFQVESTGGVEIKEIKYKYSITETNI